MSGILVMAEVRRGEIHEISLELVGAARRLVADTGGPLTVAVVAPDDAAAGRLKLEGVDEVVVVRAPVDPPGPAEMIAALRALVAELGPDVVIVGQTAGGMAMGPAFAAVEGLGFASDVFELRHAGESLQAIRGAYGDRLTATVEFPGSERVLVMLRQGAHEPAAGRAEVSLRVVEPDIERDDRIEHLGFKEPESSGVDITKADLLVSVGRGAEDEDGVERFQRLAKKLGATLSGSRPLVDAGWLPGERQVGQSGKTVKPQVYLAFGISGAVQHLAGIDADTVIAVNTDPRAPIFGVADFAAVVDMFDLADELERSAR